MADVPSSAKPPDPVRLRVYGFLRVTRRGYICLLACGFVFLLVVIGIWLATSPPEKPPGVREPHFSFVLLSFLHRYLPWIVAAAAILESIEAIVMFRRFRREEQRRVSQPS